VDDKDVPVNSNVDEVVCVSLIVDDVGVSADVDSTAAKYNKDPYSIIVLCKVH